MALPQGSAPVLSLRKQQTAPPLHPAPLAEARPPLQPRSCAITVRWHSAFDYLDACPDKSNHNPKKIPLHQPPQQQMQEVIHGSPARDR
ncbi:hypothetical protein, partial [Frankia tisae]|uniref:hypothetical protein n=1 Tax=Frankia tisae TaxID=2950104 RepID=UPI0021C1AA8A